MATFWRKLLLSSVCSICYAVVRVVVALLLVVRLVGGDDVAFALEPLEDIDAQPAAVGLEVVVETRVDFAAVDHQQHDGRQHRYAEGGAECLAEARGYQYPADVVDNLVDAASHGPALADHLAPVAGRIDAELQVGQHQSQRRQQKPADGGDQVGRPSQIRRQGAVDYVAFVHVGICI